VAQLSEWLQLMLAEIARKREEARRGAEEQQARSAETPAQEPQATPSS
jgi:hypothetical protein